MQQEFNTRYPYTNLAEFALNNPHKRPETHPLFIDDRTGETISLYHLRKLVGCLHAGLKQFGLQRGDTVCVYSPNNIYMAPIYFGVMAAAMTISPANTSYVSSEIQRALTVGNAKILIAHPRNLDIALDAAQAVGIPRSHVFSIIRDPQQRVPMWMDVLVDYNQPGLPPVKLTHEESKNTVAYLCFSSGTTGKSKGVMTSHYNCISLALESDKYAGTLSNPEHKTLIGVIPLYHFAGIYRMFNMGIAQGHTTVIVDKYSIECMCEAIQRFKVCDLPAAPPIVIHLVKNPIVDKYDLSSLKLISVDSAPISADVIRKVIEKYNVVCAQGYGLTEVSPSITYQLPEFFRPDSVGRVIPIMKYKVIDENGNELGIDQPGELLVKGPNVMLGYKDDEEATRGALDKDGWLHTGDIVKLDKDGNVYIVDRIKELIKYKGFQVAPVELEAVLLSCPYVGDAGVIGIYNDKQGTELPLAYVALAPQYRNMKQGQQRQQEMAQKIREYVDSRVAAHKRLRGGVRIIDQIPKSDAGKILRKAMKEIYAKKQKRNAKL